MNPEDLPPEFSKFFIPLRQGTKCPNCGGKKKDGMLICKRCEKAEAELEKQLEKGITVEFSDGTKTTLRKPKCKSV